MEKILLAEDDERLRNLFEKIIQDTFPDYGVESFSDGDSLNKRLKEDVEDVRLIVTDNQMPGMIGSEIIRQYAREPRFERISFVLLYGGNEEIGKRAIENGAFDFIIKPLGMEKYSEVLGKALNFSQR